jgi:hypothetical protein
MEDMDPKSTNATGFLPLFTQGGSSWLCLGGSKHGFGKRLPWAVGNSCIVIAISRRSARTIIRTQTTRSSTGFANRCSGIMQMAGINDTVLST